jgi:gliding motility-associated-like protein
VGYSISDYYVEKRDESGGVYFSANYGITNKNYSESPKDTISQRFYYRIKGVPIDPTASLTYSNELEYTLQPKLLVPNAFTPNGDGLNDVFLPKTLFISSFALTVYNSWGEAIFHSNDLSQGWDGKKGGQECPVGVYAYTVDVSDPQGNKLSSRGTVTLLK